MYVFRILVGENIGCLEKVKRAGYEHFIRTLELLRMIFAKESNILAKVCILYSSSQFNLHLYDRVKKICKRYQGESLFFYFLFFWKETRPLFIDEWKEASSEHSILSFFAFIKKFIVANVCLNLGSYKSSHFLQKQPTNSN